MKSDSPQPESKAPSPIQRPRLALWMFERGLTITDASQNLDVGREQVRRYCLPFGHGLRAVPPTKVMRRIVAWTSGGVTPADFYPPDLGGPRARAETAEAQP